MPRTGQSTLYWDLLNLLPKSHTNTAMGRDDSLGSPNIETSRSNEHIYSTESFGREEANLGYFTTRTNFLARAGVLGAGVTTTSNETFRGSRDWLNQSRLLNGGDPSLTDQSSPFLSNQQL